MAPATLTRAFVCSRLLVRRRDEHRVHPHCRDPYFDYNAMWDAFELLKRHAGGFPLTMGFEVNHAKLMDLGMQWVDHLPSTAGTSSCSSFPPVPTSSCSMNMSERSLSSRAVAIPLIIAHPERYRAVQQDIDVARRLVKMGASFRPRRIS